MDPFKITCVSCRAVLTVRKESMIGQIIACPRCNMMVQVLPPAGYVAAEKSAAATPPSAMPEPTVVGHKTKAAAAAAVVTTLFDATDALASATPPAPPIPKTAPTDPVFAATFDDAVDAFTDPPASSKSITPARSTAKAATPSHEPAHAEAAHAEFTPPPAPTTLPPVASRWATWKFPAMIAGGAVAGAAIVATALTLLSGETPTSTVAANTNATPPIAAAPTADPTAAGANAPPVAPAEPSPVISAGEHQTAAAAAAAAANIERPADDPLAKSLTDEAANAESASVESAAGESDATAAAEPTVPDAAAETPPAAEEAAAPEETAAAEQPKLRIDPLEIDPEGLNLSTLYNGPPRDPLAASQLPGEPAGVELSVPAAHEAPPDDAPPDAAPNAAGAVRRDEQAVGAPGDNVAALLARKTPELKIQNMPLCRLLDLSVQLSGVPVSVAPYQLRLAAVSAGQPATADVKDATIEEFLAAALKPLRLQPVVVNDQIVLIRGGNNPRRSVAYAVEDLASDPAAVEQLAANIQKLVAPESWQAAGGAGTIAVDGKQLKIETGEAVQYEVLLLLERSRAALGLPPRSKYPAALVGADAAPVALAERLGAPATFTFSQYTPLREIFRHWQEEMEVAVLVDWPALTDLRLWPNTRIACSSSGKPWEAALDEVLTPLGLAWRPIDKRTIEITTVEKAASDSLLEVYRLNPEALAGVDDLVGQLEQLTAADENAQNAHFAAIILNDEHSLLMVRQPAPLQRQIAAHLAEMQLLAASQPANGN
ncbi:MAG: hypothetical protein C0485_03500 [Pirellula sp.]|nr:hypothetical protein [Pirellula sp.]